jgi:hypothetical protein
MDQPTNGLTRLPQGSLGLLETETARTLLASAIPGRLAYIAADGTPRVVPTWVHWTGQELVMATFVAAPHVARPARRIRDLQANPHVAICIDTQDSPPASLTLRGAVDVQIAPGVAA